MSEAEPEHTRPTEAPDGKLIVYIVLRDAGVYVECPALDYNLGIPYPSYEEGSVKRSFETVLRSKSMAIVRRSEEGELFPEKKVEYAKKCANGTPQLPLIYVQETDGHHKEYH